MTYIKIENGEIIETGTLFILLPNISNSVLLTESELKELKIYKPVLDTVSIEPWQYHERTDYIYDLENDLVNEVKLITDITLEAFKEQKNKEIIGNYEELSLEGFVCSNSIKLDCRECDKINWSVAYSDDTMKTKIKDFDNVIHSTTVTEFDTMYFELKQYYLKIQNDKWILNTIVNDSTSYSEINEVYWRFPNYDVDGVTVLNYTYNPILEV